MDAVDSDRAVIYGARVRSDGGVVRRDLSDRTIVLDPTGTVREDRVAPDYPGGERRKNTWRRWPISSAGGGPKPEHAGSVP